MQTNKYEKKKIIVYGVGISYEELVDEINDQFEVVAVTSSNQNENHKYSNYIQKEDIKCIDYDSILICSNYDVEIVNTLVNELNVPKEKILLKDIVFNKRGLFFSQYNEDAILFLVLSLIGIDYKQIVNLKYLELGTNHPIKLNNTFGLYLAGARGILVEPNRDLKNIIQTARPKDCLIEKAVSTESGKATFYSMKSSEVSTLCIDKLDNDFCKQYDNFEVMEKYEVETITINQLLREIDFCPDILSIDIEGDDLKILCSIDYKKFRPKIMIVELGAWGAKVKEGKDITDLLIENGYIRITHNGTNGIFLDSVYKEYIEDYCV